MYIPQLIQFCAHFCSGRFQSWRVTHIHWWQCRCMIHLVQRPSAISLTKVSKHTAFFSQFCAIVLYFPYIHFLILQINTREKSNIFSEDFQNSMQHHFCVLFQKSVLFTVIENPINQSISNPISIMRTLGIVLA